MEILEEGTHFHKTETQMPTRQFSSKKGVNFLNVYRVS
jgi:hypothetical protein